jgi:F-type H+-transporting ATPase subunit a
MQAYAITHFFNSLFGPAAAALLHLVGVRPEDPAMPITNAYSLELLAFFILIAFFVLVRITLSVEKPGTIQHIAEMIHGFSGDAADQIIGHGYERFQAFVTCVFLFVLLNNVMGLFPDVITPTGTPAVPLGIALCTFVYYNFYGFKEQGIFKYIKHFMGPIPVLAPLLFPIELISHCARVMSLTIRLYANMLASDLITLVAFMLFPIALPIAGLGLHAIVSLIQAYVFMLLAMIYLTGAVSHDEAHGEMI